MTKKKLKTGSIPTLNMPQKSHTQVVSPRPMGKYQTIMNNKETFCYKNLKDLTSKVKVLKSLEQWKQSHLQNEVIFTKFESNIIIPKLEITIDDGLGFTILIYGWLLPEDHDIYKSSKRSMKNITVTNLIKQCEDYILCIGTKADLSSKLIIHSISKSTKYLCENEDEEKPLKPYENIVYYRRPDCSVLIKNGEYDNICASCKEYNDGFNKTLKISTQKLMIPAKTKAPVSKTAPQRLLLTIQTQRLKCNQLQSELENMRKELTERSR